MSTEPTLLLQKEIYEILNGDATLDGLISGVFDFIPDNQTFPFVQIGEIEANERGSNTHDGFEFRATINVWSRPVGRGRAETRTIQSRIYELLNRANLTVSGFSTVACFFDFSEVIVDPDAVTYHGIQRFRILLGGN